MTLLMMTMVAIPMKYYGIAAPLVQEQARGGLDNLDGLKRASEDLLYEKTMGCDDKFMLLHSVLELLKLKARNRWSDKSFTDLLVL